MHPLSRVSQATSLFRKNWIRIELNGKSRFGGTFGDPFTLDLGRIVDRWEE